MRVVKAQMKTLANVTVDIVRKKNIKNLAARKIDIKNAKELVIDVIKKINAQARIIIKRP